MRVRRGLAVIGFLLVVCNCPPAVRAQITTNSLDIQGKLSFSTNAEGPRGFGILRDEACLPGAGWIGGSDDPAVTRDDWISYAKFTAVLDSRSSGTDMPPPPSDCWQPPFDTLGYRITVADYDNQRIFESDRYKLGGRVDFDSIRTWCSVGSEGYDKYFMRIDPPWLTSELGDPNFRRETGCQDPAAPACLIDQDMDECFGILVIEYWDDCVAPAMPLCPGETHYPDTGVVTVWVPDGLNSPQAESTVDNNRQTRLAVRAAACPMPGGCVSANGEELVLECGTQDAPCDFASVTLPPAMAAATHQISQQVDLLLQLGTDPYLNSLKFGRRMIHVPIVCGGVTRIRQHLLCPEQEKSKLHGRFEVLGYEDEVLYCEGLRTPTVAVDDGPSQNERLTWVKNPETEDVCGRSVHTFKLETIYRSPHPSLNGLDKSYAAWASFVLKSQPPETPGLDEWVRWTSFAKGRGPQFEDPVGPLGPEWRNSTGYALFAACAVEPPPPDHPAPPLIAYPDSEGDWLYFAKPDYDYLFKRCLGYPAPPDQVSSDVNLTPLDYPCIEQPQGPCCEDLTLDPFVFAPREIQGCLVLDDQGLPDTAETLKFNFDVSCDQAVGLKGFWENSRVEAVGYKMDVHDGDGPCRKDYSGDDFFDSTTIFETYKIGGRAEVGRPRQAEIWAKLVEGAGGECPPHGVGPDARVFRYRIVPGQSGNLGNPYLLNRFRLQFDGWDEACQTPVEGAIRLNPKAGENLGNGVLVQNLRQDVPGTRQAIAQNLDVCLGKVQAFFESDRPLSTSANERPMMIGEGVDPGCDDAKVFFTHSGDHQDTYFEGRVLPDDPAQALIVMPLPEGRYRFQPYVVLAGRHDRTLFPPTDLIDVECGSNVLICLGDSIPGPTATPPTPAEIVLPEGADLDGDCMVPVDIPFRLLDCDQGASATVYLTVTSDDVEEFDPSNNLIERGFAQPVAERAPLDPGDCPQWDDCAVVLDQVCGLPVPRVFHLWLGDGPSSTCPRSGTTNYTFTVGDAPRGDPNRHEITEIVSVSAQDSTPPAVTCPSARFECLGSLTQEITGLCQQGVTDNCDPYPLPVEWEASGATTGGGTGDCADGDYNQGLTMVRFSAEDNFCVEGACSVEVLLPSQPVACIEEIIATCQQSLETVITLDASCTTEDTYPGQPDGLDGQLSYSWTTGQGCPADAWIENPDQKVATLHVPDQNPAGCDPVVSCTVDLHVTERVDATHTCASDASAVVIVNPAPVAVAKPGPPDEPYRFCWDGSDPQGTSRYQLDGSASTGCGGASIEDYLWTPDLACPGWIDATADPSRPFFVVPNAEIPVTCDLTLTVRDENDCTGSDQTTITVTRPPIADPGGPYLGCMAGPPATETNFNLDGSGSHADPVDPGCPLSFAWSSTCPGTGIPDPTLPEPTLGVSNGPDPVECQVCLRVTDCRGCQSTETCVSVRLCPNPKAEFEPRFTLNTLGCGGQVPPPEVLFVNESTPGGCEALQCHWEFPPDGIPTESDSCDDQLVVFADAGVKQPSLRVWENIGKDPSSVDVICEDMADSCGICVPSCVKIAHPANDGAVIRFKVDCTGNDPCGETDALEVKYVFYDVAECCPPPFSLASDPPPIASITLGGCDPGNPGPVLVNASSVEITDPTPPDDKLYVTATFAAGCVINALRALGCACDTAVPEVSVRLDVGLDCPDCTYPLVIDQEVVPPAGWDKFKIHCTDHPCWPTSDCPCP